MAFINKITVEVYDKQDNEQGKYLVTGIDDIYWAKGNLDVCSIVMDELEKIDKLGNRNTFSKSNDNQESNDKPIMTFDKIITKIKQIIGDDQSFKLEFYSGEIAFCIYEHEVVISYLSKNNDLHIDCDLTKGQLGVQEIGELNQIMILLDENKELLKIFC